MKTTPLTIVGYRYRWSSERGVAGTFYWTFVTWKQYLEDTMHQQRDFHKAMLEFTRAIVLSDEDVGPYIGFPTESLALRWFPRRDFWTEAERVFGEAAHEGIEGTDGLLMDIAVAMEATRRGHDGIVYGGESIVDLRHLLAAGLRGKGGERVLIRKIVEHEHT